MIELNEIETTLLTSVCDKGTVRVSTSGANKPEVQAAVLLHKHGLASMLASTKYLMLRPTAQGRQFLHDQRYKDASLF